VGINQTFKRFNRIMESTWAQERLRSTRGYRKTFILWGIKAISLIFLPTGFCQD